MRVLFLKHVVNVWKEWEIKEVKDWFATNNLIPQGLAIKLTPEEEKRLNDKKKKQDKHKMQLIENRHSIVEELNQKRLDFSLKTWENWKIYWWINEKDILSLINKKFKIELARSNIYMPDWIIKKLWEHFVYIKLWKDSMAKIIINIKND